MASGSRPSSKSGHGRASAARRVIVSLEFLPGNTSVQTPITNEFSSHLPLTDLQWKSSSRSTTRTIETLSLDFRSFRDTIRDAAPQQIPINLLERPYLHLLFVASDDNEAYRITLRPQIREWLNSVQSKKLQEWLIVHVTSQKTGPAKFYLRKGSVFDKIRADFNVGKRDRVLQLPVPGSQADEGATDYTAIWREFLSKAKESIVLSFDGNFTSYEEDVRKIDSQRQMPGWNFCTFFIQKEGLAHSFEAMNLLEDALIQYDELEASYYLGAKDQTLPWFSRIGGSMDRDDSLSILSSNEKEYRQSIMKNDISVFDFRVYLFSRQAALVSGLGRVVDLAKRAKAFIYSTAKMLRSHHGVLRRYFIESWVFTSSLEIVEKCNQLLNARKMNAAAIPDLLPILAELTELATRQLEKLGMVFGYLPKTHPFLMSMHSSLVDDLEERDEGDGEDGSHSPKNFESSNVQLQNSFKDQEAFDTLYRSMLNQVHEAWVGSMRLRSANKIKGTLAALEQARKNTQRSLAIYSDLIKEFSQTNWTAVEAQLLRQTIALREGTTNQVDRTERLLSVLALIRTGLTTGSLKWTLDTTDADGRETAGSLLEEARKLSRQFDKDFAVVDVPAFSVSLASPCGRFLEHEDGLEVTVNIHNHLPCAIDIDEVRLKFHSMAEEPLWLKCGPVCMSPGKNEIAVSAMVSLVGTYALETSQIRASRIVFQHSHRDTSRALVPQDQSHIRYNIINGKQPIVHFTQDPAAIDVTAEDVLTTSIEKPRQTLLNVHPGRGTLIKAVLHFPVASDIVEILYETAQTIQGGFVVHADPEKRSLSLSSIQAGATLQLSVAYHSLVRSQYTVLPVTMEYYAAVRPEKRRLMKTCIRLRTALPLDVNVHDYRRQTFLLSKFTVSTVQRLPLRIKDALLEDTPLYRAIPACRQRSRAVIVKRGQPGSFPFRLERQDGTSASSTDPERDYSRLSITFLYRTMEADLKAVLKPHLIATLQKHAVNPSRRLVDAISCLLSADHSLIKQFNTLHMLDLLGTEDIRLSTSEAPLRLGSYKDGLRSYWTIGDEWDRIQSAIMEAHQTPVPTGLLANEPWHSVSIPFEVPPIAIFNRVSFKLPSFDEVLPQVGQHIPCTLNIDCSLDWGSPNDHRFLQTLFTPARDEGKDAESPNGQRMVYEIEANPDDWIVAGKIRAEFEITSMSGSHIECPLELIPLREGVMFVPSVNVHPLPAALEEGQFPSASEVYDDLPSSETYQDNVAQCIEVTDAGSTSTDLQYNIATGEVSYPFVSV